MRRLRSIQVRLVLTYLVLIAFSTTVTFLFFLPRIQQYLEKKTEDQLRAQSRLLGSFISSYEYSEDANLALVVQDLREKFTNVLQITTVRVYDPEGLLVADSASPEWAPPAGASVQLASDAQEALTGEQVTWIEDGAERVLHVTNPLRAPQRVFGAVDISAPLKDRETMREVRRLTLVALLVSGLASWIVSFVLAQTIVRPVERIRRAADRIAQGDLTQRVPLVGADELGRLGGAINDMAAQLESRIGEIVSERSKMNSLLEALVDGVVAVDRENRVDFLNPVAEMLFEVSAREAIGKPLTAAVTVPDIPVLVQECVDHERLVSREVHHGARVLRVFCLPFKDQAHSHRGTMIVVHDITDLRRLEMVRSEFLGSVSHELRTPLTIIKGFVITLLDNPVVVADPDLERSLQMVDRETDRLARLVEDVLELSRLRSRKRALELSPMDPEEAVHDTVGVLMAHSERVGVGLSVELEEEHSCILADADRFRQIVINLVDNGIKYTPPGGEVCVRTRRSERHWVLEIVDTGVGIAREEIPFLFERFFRGKDKRKKEARGTGLGLAIVQELVEAHHARVEVESELGKGTLVRVWFPAAEGPEGEGP